MGLIGHGQLGEADLRGEKVAVIGFGSQGRAQALNLRDSGVEVTVGLRSGSPRAADAEAQGLAVHTPDAAVAAASIVALLVPEEAQPEVYRRSVAPCLREGGALVFAHGFNVHYRRIRPRPGIDVLLVAPFGIGAELRARYVAGGGTAGQVAVAQDASGRARARALGYACALGHDRVAVIETSFAEETETDLFAEQTILVGGLSGLIRAGFETLVEAGYQPEIAYFCCLEEVRLMASVIQSEGLAGLWQRISSTAAYGGLLTGPRVVNEASRAAMREALGDIRSGRFAERFAREIAAHGPAIAATAARDREHPLERVRRRLKRWAAGGGGGRGSDEVAS